MISVEVGFEKYRGNKSNLVQLKREREKGDGDV